MCQFVTWLIHIWVNTDIRWIMTRINVHVRDVTPSYRSIRLPSQPHLMVLQVCDMTHSYMWHDSLVYEWVTSRTDASRTWTLMRIMTHLMSVMTHIWMSHFTNWHVTNMNVDEYHDSFTCDMTRSYMNESCHTWMSHDTHQHSCSWRDSFIQKHPIATSALVDGPACEWHDPFVCVTRLAHIWMSHVTHSCVWHDSSIYIYYDITHLQYVPSDPLMGLHPCEYISIHAATHCNMLQHIATHCITLQHTVICCNTIYHTAPHWNTLQYNTTHCNTLRHIVTYCTTLRHTATHCNTLQHTATHCNTL